MKKKKKKKQAHAGKQVRKQEEYIHRNIFNNKIPTKRAVKYANEAVVAAIILAPQMKQVWQL